MSTGAETFDTNQQKGARELRHPKESASDDDDGHHHDDAEPELEPEPEPEHGS